MIRRLNEPARTAREAVDRHIRVIRQTLHCVTRTGHLRRSGTGSSLSVANTDRYGNFSRLRRDEGDIYLEAVQRFEAYQAHRGWRITVHEYVYALYDQHPEDHSARPLFAWHWHPTSRDDPHLHLGADSATVKSMHKLHVPTRRVSFDAVIGFAIQELGVKPARDTWQESLADAARLTRKFARWSDDLDAAT